MIPSTRNPHTSREHCQLSQHHNQHPPSEPQQQQQHHNHHHHHHQQQQHNHSYRQRQHQRQSQRQRHITNSLLHFLPVLPVLCMLTVAGGVGNVAAAAKYANHANDDGNTLAASSERVQSMQSIYQRLVHRTQRDLERSGQQQNNLESHQHCDNVRDFFASIDIRVRDSNEEKGAICGGSCCSNETEIILREKAAADFERLLHFNTKSLRSTLISAANLFRDHVLELTAQSEHKTLFVFSQVYRRMLPLSTQLIHELYADIRSHLTNNNDSQDLEASIHEFFVNLFPVAYHQAVNLNKENYGELHADYIACLKHTFDDLQPFDTIPKEIKHNLIHNVQTAQILINLLEQSAQALSEIDDIYGTYMTDACTKQLLKMSYCQSCSGLRKEQAKPCNSYCMNVMRGCSVQYVGVLDNPWSNVVDAIENLFVTHIHEDSGIILTIKQLDHKLSEAIMQAMQNGPDLEKKVKKTCGTPKLLAVPATDEAPRPLPYPAKWATPPDAEIFRFLSTIEKSKDFYSNIVNSVCEDDDIQRSDHHCWTGDHVGDYIQLVMTTGVTAQRYNPEVPLELNSQSAKINELVDKLIKIRKNINAAVPTTTRSYSDIQSDMARHDEEGSGRISDDTDDEEYGNNHGSGDGSGDGSIGQTSSPIDDNEIAQRSSAHSFIPTSSCYCRLITLTSLVTLYSISFSFS